MATKRDDGRFVGGGDDVAMTRPPALEMPRDEMTSDEARDDLVRVATEKLGGGR